MSTIVKHIGRIRQEDRLPDEIRIALIPIADPILRYGVTSRNRALPNARNSQVGAVQVHMVYDHIISADLC